MINPYGLATLPIAIKLASDVAQARVTAGANVANSILDYVNSMYAMQPAARGMAPMPGMAAPFVPTTAAPARAAGFTVNVGQRTPWASQPSRVSFVEGDETYTAHVELPNTNVNDISVRVEGNQIQVYSHDDLAAVVATPDNTDPDSITADYNDGVLQVRIKKDVKRVRREVKVQSGAKPAAAPSGKN